LSRWARVPVYNILFLRENVLEKAEKVKVTDVLAAVRCASGQAPDVSVEVWFGRRRVAIIKPRPKL
jgi:hypothetical protein